MPTPSPQLLAANRQLLALRAAKTAATGATAAAAASPDAADSSLKMPAVPQSQAVESAALARICDDLPPHLGWESGALTRHLRGRPNSAVNPTELPAIKPVPDLVSAPSLVKTAPSLSSLKLYPDIALALLREERVADGRLWLLLRALDSDGRGCWNYRTARERLTAADSPYRVCGERQFRKLLARGEGLFWRRDGQKRIWLRGRARVAAALGVDRLRQKPVLLPIAALCRPIGAARAHLYASFHSGRGGADGGRGMPISRRTLADLSGVSPRAQQIYDARAAVEVKMCIGVGMGETAVDSHEEAWRNGRSGFKLQDYHGRQGERGKTYHARRLPNCYSGPHPLSVVSGSGRRRLNRQLADLREKGAGNGRGRGAGGGRRARRYAADGAEGARIWGRMDGRRPIYWRNGSGGRGVVIWHLLLGMDS